MTCSAYNASKAAVHQLCRSVAQEWGEYNIRINTLSCGVSPRQNQASTEANKVQYVRTAMSNALIEEKPDVADTWMRGALLGRLGAPEDFKAPAVYMLADGSAFMTGADLRVDGGHCASA